MTSRTGYFWKITEQESYDSVLCGCAPYKKPEDAFSDMMKVAADAKLPKHCNFIVFNRETYREDFK